MFNLLPMVVYPLVLRDTWMLPEVDILLVMSMITHNIVQVDIHRYDYTVMWICCFYQGFERKGLEASDMLHIILSNVTHRNNFATYITFSFFNIFSQNYIHMKE